MCIHICIYGDSSWGSMPFFSGNEKVLLNQPASHYLWVRQQGALQVRYLPISILIYIHIYTYIRVSNASAPHNRRFVYLRQWKSTSQSASVPLPMGPSTGRTSGHIFSNYAYIYAYMYVYMVIVPGGICLFSPAMRKCSSISRRHPTCGYVNRAHFRSYFL